MKKFFSFVLAVLCLSTQAYADKVTASTTLPSNGKPEHVYTMVSGNGAYVSPTTTPVEGDAENGLFAFYAVDGLNGAYYIYSHNAKKWLTYDKSSSYGTGANFVKLSDSKVEGTYFKLDNYADDFYQISPYTTAGTAQATYLNYFGGVSACSGKTLGLWTDNGIKDGGSRYTFAEYVIAERTYTISVPEGVTLKIAGVEYANGSTITVEGSIDKSTISITAPEGKFTVVSVNDVNNTITVNVATLPVLPSVEKYENAWVYPKQQDNVGAASISEDNGVYVLSNKVLAAGFMKVGEALYFAGSDAMNLVAGTEPFTVAFGNGDNVPASAMTLKNVSTETLVAQPTAIGGAEHFAGVQLVANYEYAYKGAKIEIVWRAVLRDGSHYLRTEMELKGVDDVDMFNIIPMIYNVDTKAAGSTPKVVGNTRGATIVSDNVFAGLETPTAYNTVGEATGEEDKWELVNTNSVSLTAASWTQVAENDVPKRVEEATGANYPYVRAYKMTNVELKKNQKVEIEVKYTSGNHRLNFGGADLLASNGDIAANDYHSGYSGSQHSNNTFTFTVPNDGTYSIRVMVEGKSESIDASSRMTVKIYNAKEGAVINTDIVGIQGRWSRNTTLAAGETWKVGAVVGLIAQDGKQSDSNIRNTQKRRSFLAYSERERAVPWRAFPCYISWYELNINRNNAVPGQEHTNFTSDQVLDVLSQWKTNFFDKYGEGPAAFVIDDGWDNYGTWTFHKEFPNQMRDMAAAAKEMGAGVGAWLGPVGGYGQSGNYRRAYWSSRGGMQLSNPEYYKVFKDAAYNLVCNQDGQNGFNRNTDNYMFFKFDGISAQFSATGPDAGDVGNENAEGIIRLERYVREELREDIFFNTTVGTWASPFWYQISDATWRQENDHGRTGDNSINRENWITYRDRLVYQNYVSNSPLCPINTLMTHGFILTKYGPPADDSRDYNTVLRELRCAFLCGSGMVELYNDYSLMNEINGGQLWKDLAECIAWQKKNADVLPDAHWVGGNPWTGSKSEIYGWASWNGAKATLALRNASNSQQTYTFTLRQALEIPANITGSVVLKKSFRVQDDLRGLTVGSSIDIDQTLTVTLPGSSVFAFDGIDAADYVDGWENEYDELEKEEDEEKEPELISRTGWGVTASSQETSGDPGQATNAIDGNNGTFWHTVYARTYPHWIEFDMTKAYTIYSFDYVSRFDNTNSNGNILDYKLYISDSPMNGNYNNATLAASGTFVYGKGVNHLIQLETPVAGRYVALVAESGTKGDWAGNAATKAANCAEFYVYGIEKQASTNEEAKAALAEAIAQAEAMLAVITIGDGVGEYSGGEYPTNAALESVLGSMRNYYNTIDANTPIAEIEAYIAMINETMASYTLNMPKAGKYYRFKGNSGNYIDASSIYNNATAKAGQMSMKSGDNCNFAGTIFYLDENDKLLNYHTGTYVTATREIANVGVGGNTWTISASSIAGKYKIKSNDGNWLHDNSGNRADRCDKDPDGHSETHSWIIEEVEALPVSITSAGYATFFAPVAVTVPSDVTAHTVAINGEWATLSEPLSVIPANTGVVLAGEGSHDFAITTANAFEGDNALRGTAAATYITEDAYVLGYINVAEEGQPEKKEVGFYTATKNQQDGASWKNNSHKAYLPMSNANGAVSYSFRFPGTTGVSEVKCEPAVDASQNGEVKAIYDLQGRRLERIATPGIYIVGGRRVLVK